MNYRSLIKKASRNPSLSRALQTMAKIAQSDSGDMTQFNESVPAAQMDPMTGQPATEQEQGWHPQSDATSTGYAQESQYLPANQAAMLQPGGSASSNPLVAGAEAARAFVGPDVFNAAMQGDPNAMNMVTQIASTIVNGATGSVAPAAQSAQPVAEGQPVAEEAPQQQNAFSDLGIPATPEEQIANLIISPVEAPAPEQQPQAPNQSQGNGKSPSVTVKVNGQEKTSSLGVLKKMSALL